MRNLNKKGGFDFLRVVLVIWAITFVILKDNIISYFTFKDSSVLAYCENIFSSFLLTFVFLIELIAFIILSNTSAFFGSEEAAYKKGKLKKLIVYIIFVAVVSLSILFTHFACNAKIVLYNDATLKNYNIFGDTDLELSCDDAYVIISPEYTGRGGSYNANFKIVYRDNEIILSSTDFKNDKAIKEFTASLKNEPTIEVPYDFKESFEGTNPNKHQQFLYDTYFKQLAENQ